MKKQNPLAGLHASLNKSPKDIWGEPEVEDEDDSREPTHKCQVCNTARYVDDYQNHTPSWCDWCGQVRPHERLDYES